MRQLTFKLDDRLRQIIAHAAAHDPGPYFGSEIPRSLFFVKDDGAYLMSAGKPGLLNSAGPGATSNVVQYAEGHDPRTPEYDYDFTRSICGGDDFGEPLEVSFFTQAVARGATTITIKLTDTEIFLEAE